MSNEIVKWVFKLNSALRGEEDLYWVGGNTDYYQDRDFLETYGPLSQAHTEDTRYFAERLKITMCTIVPVTLKQLFKAKLAGK